jgi:O-antigen/teichoic acid export membrane protein
MSESTPPAGDVRVRPGGAAGLGASLARNLSMLSVSQAVGLVLSLVSVKLLAEALTVPQFGVFTYVFSVLSLVLAAADPGLTTTLVRDLAQAPARTGFLIERALGLKLTSAALVVALSWVVAWFTFDGPVLMAWLIISAIVPLQAFGVTTAVLQARVAIKRGVAAELVNRLTGFAALVLALTLGFGLYGAVGALVVGEVAGLIAVTALTWQFARPRPRVDLVQWRYFVRGTLTVGGAAILATLVNRVDFLMLERMTDLETVGYYGAAYRLPLLLERLPALALATVFPLMSRLADTDRTELAAVYRWSVQRAAMVAVPVVAVVYAGAPWLLPWWTTEEFLPGVPALRWLILATGCIYLAVVTGHLLIAIRQTRISLAIWLVAAPLNISLNWWWIPVHGATGAAAATFVTYAVVMTASLWASHRCLANR